mmetsp:Transcript_25275/g.47983  ORF Transcript_25275/g.47983 Transcript_25275/m.47983 type:complete len:86 (-) Transcript_25275:5903-6160(-)
MFVVPTSAAPYTVINRTRCLQWSTVLCCKDPGETETTRKLCGVSDVASVDKKAGVVYKWDTSSWFNNRHGFSNNESVDARHKQAP